VENRLNERFADEDGDLVADPPADAADWLDPAVLTFSYIAIEGAGERYAEVWKEFVEHLGRVTGKQVEYLVLDGPAEQLQALKQGTLHVTGLNTGNVPIGVNDCGFVPVCTPGNEQGMVGYTMKIVVPADSPIQGVAGLKGHTLALTQPNSNSGFKAPLVLLMHDFGLQVERDFTVSMSRSQDASILGVAEGRYEAAAVASDMIRRSIGRGLVEPDALRTIYTSERFATAGIGYTHNLAPSLAEKVRRAFLEFDWAGSGLEQEFAAANVNRFVPINYKDDWALVRRIDNAVGFQHIVDDQTAPEDG
jgi:phosphonate transport system substrate-binding protein